MQVWVNSVTAGRNNHRQLQSTDVATTASVSFTLLPYGGANDNTADDLLAALSAGEVTTSDSTFVVAAVADVTPSAVCGNGVCEIGEGTTNTDGKPSCAQPPLRSQSPPSLLIVSKDARPD